MIRMVARHHNLVLASPLESIRVEAYVVLSLLAVDAGIEVDCQWTEQWQHV